MRVQAGLEAGHRLAQQVLFRACVDLDVISGGDDAIDLVDVEQSNATFGTDCESRWITLKRTSIDRFQGLGNATSQPSDARYSQREYLADEKSLDTATRMSHVQYFVRILLRLATHGYRDHQRRRDAEESATAFRKTCEREGCRGVSADAREKCYASRWGWSHSWPSDRIRTT